MMYNVYNRVLIICGLFISLSISWLYLGQHLLKLENHGKEMEMTGELCMISFYWGSGPSGGACSSALGTPDSSSM